MVFRDEMSEDCLYLNVWTPAANADEKLPVMFWIHGGGFQAGSASEPRQDGEQLARKGVVVVSANHRLGVFGFLAHAELSKESGRNASGNYGLLDQVAALQWVHDNVAAFGGDPGNVTIFGESAGSFAVSALVVSPLAKGLVHKAIGESGAFFALGGGPLGTRLLAAGEEQGAKFATGLGAADLAALRAKTTDEVLQAALKGQWFAPIVDGHVLPKTAAEIYAAGTHNHVPLLAGWNADEIRSSVTLAPVKPTVASFTEQTRKRFGPAADAMLKVYAPTTDAEAIEVAAALASDTFIGYATWKWIQVHAATTKVPVYRFSFDRKIPIAPDTKVNGVVATVGRHRRATRRRDRVRVRPARLRPEGTWRQRGRHAVGSDDVVLVQLRALGQPQRQGPADLAGLQRRHRRGRPASGHDDCGEEGRVQGAVRGAGRDGGGGQIGT